MSTKDTAPKVGDVVLVDGRHWDRRSIDRFRCVVTEAQAAPTKSNPDLVVYRLEPVASPESFVYEYGHKNIIQGG